MLNFYNIFISFIAWILVCLLFFIWYLFQIDFSKNSENNKFQLEIIKLVFTVLWLVVWPLIWFWYFKKQENYKNKILSLSKIKWLKAPIFQSFSDYINFSIWSIYLEICSEKFSKSNERKLEKINKSKKSYDESLKRLYDTFEYYKQLLENIWIAKVAFNIKDKNILNIINYLENEYYFFNPKDVMENTPFDENSQYELENYTLKSKLNWTKKLYIEFQKPLEKLISYLEKYAK